MQQRREAISVPPNGSLTSCCYTSTAAGATIFDATDIPSETKVAFNAGAGLKWRPSKRFGARLQARYTPIYVHDASSDFCDPFGLLSGLAEPVRADRGSGRPLLIAWNRDVRLQPTRDQAQLRHHSSPSLSPNPSFIVVLAGDVPSSALRFGSAGFRTTVW